MRTRLSLVIVTLGLASGCATPSVNAPSLAPRAAEGIDPRVPIPNELVVGPADASLSTRLAALVDQAQSGDTAFHGVIDNAERLAASAGTQSSESWIAAQQALSAAQSARAPTTRALGDIDELASTALETKGGIPAGNLAAIQKAAATVSEIDRGQAERLEAIEKRLGL